MTTPKLPKILDKYQILIAPSIALVTITILIILVVIPQINKIIEIRKTIASDRDRLVALNKKIQTLEQVNVNVYKENLDKTLKILPYDKDIPAGLNQIQALVETSGIVLKSYSVNPTNPIADAYPSFLMRLSVVGDLASIKRFIDSVMLGSLAMGVSGFEITGVKTTGEYEVSITVAAYYQPSQVISLAVDKQVSLPTQKELGILEKIKTSLSIIPIPSDVGNIPRGKIDPFQ